MSNGIAWVDQQQRYFNECHRITKGRNKGRIEVILPTGKKKIIEEKDIVRFPATYTNN